MKKLIVCPSCGKPTVKERMVYLPDKVNEVSLKEYSQRRVNYCKDREKHRGYSSGIMADISLDFPKPIQLVYKCGTCGYTEVHNFKVIE